MDQAYIYISVIFLVAILLSMAWDVLRANKQLREVNKTWKFVMDDKARKDNRSEGDLE